MMDPDISDRRDRNAQILSKIEPNPNYLTLKEIAGNPQIPISTTKDADKTFAGRPITLITLNATDSVACPTEALVEALLGSIEQNLDKTLDVTKRNELIEHHSTILPERLATEKTVSLEGIKRIYDNRITMTLETAQKEKVEIKILEALPQNTKSETRSAVTKLYVANSSLWNDSPTKICLVAAMIDELFHNDIERPGRALLLSSYIRCLTENTSATNREILFLENNQWKQQTPGSQNTSVVSIITAETIEKQEVDILLTPIMNKDTISTKTKETLRRYYMQNPQERAATPDQIQAYASWMDKIYQSRTGTLASATQWPTQPRALIPTRATTAEQREQNEKRKAEHIQQTKEWGAYTTAQKIIALIDPPTQTSASRDLASSTPTSSSQPMTTQQMFTPLRRRPPVEEDEE